MVLMLQLFRFSDPTLWGGGGWGTLGVERAIIYNSPQSFCSRFFLATCACLADIPSLSASPWSHLPVWGNSRRDSVTHREDLRETQNILRHSRSLQQVFTERWKTLEFECASRPLLRRVWKEVTTAGGGDG